MNLLDLISRHDLKGLSDSDCFSGEYVNLHTRNECRAIRQCIDFFASYEHIGDKWYFYTDSSDYCWYGGYCYELSRSKSSGANKGIYWLVRKNKTPYEV